jgi:hypothetical protein
VVAIGPVSVPHLVVADLDLELVEVARRDGLVLGYRDWARPSHVEGTVELVDARSGS